MAPLHPFIPIPGVLRVALSGNQAGRPFANVFHCQYSGTVPTAAQLADYADTWFGSAVGALAAIAHETVTYAEVQVTDLSSITAAQVTSGIASPGLLTGVPIPSNACALVNYNSSFRYRGGHPRTYYVAGDQASLLTVNSWTTAFVTAITTAAGDVTGSFPVGGEGGFIPGEQCAISYKSADLYRVVPLIMPIAHLLVSPGIATQRRRMRK